MSTSKKEYKLGKNEILAIDAFKMGISLTDREKKRLYNNILGEIDFRWEQMDKETYKIVSGTDGTLAVSNMGNLYYLVYNTVNKEFKWRFTKGIYDDEEGRPTSGYYIAKYPRNI